MAERLQRLLQRFLEWWNKFTTKQKAVIISAVAVVLVALGLLIYVVTRPTMITLTTAESAQQSATIRDLLNGENISYQVSDDGMTYKIKKEDEATASILLGTNDIPSAGYSINDVLDGSFSATEADKKKRYQLYLEERFAERLTSLSNVRSAEVTLSIPDDDGTLIANQEESYANVILELTDSMDSDQASGLAHYIATGLGNDNTERITIIDSDGNVLFSGGDAATSAGIATSNRKIKREAESDTAAKVRSILAGSGGNASIYDNVEIGVNLAMNFDSKNIVDYHYYVDEGQTQGYLDSRSESTTEGTNGVAGVPGTDANDDTTYVLQDNEYSSYNTSDITEDYLPSETITTTDSEVGAVSYDDSSISVVAYNYVVYNEDRLKADGTLDDMTFDEFVAQNGNEVVAEVDAELITAVSRATNIPEANISILAYDVPMFQYSEGGRSWTDWLQIALAVLIIAMLGFVVFRSLRREEEEQLEEEVSMEQLMEEGAEGGDLDNIAFSEKSEARLMIEQFVEERPEAVASLLRNWLNEEWGE